MPSFQNRVRFFVYEFDFFKRAAYIPSSNDAVRMASWKTGAIVMNENMPYGVGFGDISRRMNERYPVLYPGMKEADMILPANEWLIYGVGAGLAGLLVLTLVVLLPFFISTREAFLWRLSAAIFGFSFAVDIGLEVQFGVFIYVFITLWWWKWLTAKNI
ncbi:MAG: hypothetical protein IPM85_17855 [Chitinophagaceae bacterium]|nr:hypothetical protein [Chitinophagaceae bacterium]